MTVALKNDRLQQKWCFYCKVDGVGYVIVEVEQIFFVAQIETTIVAKTTYMVTVKFGNKNIYFAPWMGVHHQVQLLSE